jgi:hypothetical protein
MDSTWINLTVDHWFQTITHGKDWPSRQFRLSAHASETAELRLTSGENICTLEFSLSIARGEPKIEKPLERGIGVLGYRPPLPEKHDIDAVESFVGGWFWLDEGSYDETWAQVRENKYGDCIIDLEIAPVERAPSGSPVWNVQNKELISILTAGLMFKRSLQAAS